MRQRGAAQRAQAHRQARDKAAHKQRKQKADTSAIDSCAYGTDFTLGVLKGLRGLGTFAELVARVRDATRTAELITFAAPTKAKHPAARPQHNNTTHRKQKIEAKKMAASGKAERAAALQFKAPPVPPAEGQIAPQQRE